MARSARPTPPFGEHRRPDAGTDAETLSIDSASALGQMSAIIMHGIVEPLSAVILNTQASIRYLAQTPPNVEAAQASLRAVLRDSFDVSQTIRQGRGLFQGTDISKAPVDLSRAIDHVCSCMREEIRLSSIDVNLRIDGELPPVRGNEPQVRQVLANLMRNAIDSMKDCSESPKEIHISVYREKDMVFTEIADRGRGLLDDAKAFDPLIATKPSGMCIGLTICKLIIDAHQGQLWATPGQPKGTVFGFALPIERNLFSWT